MYGGCAHDSFVWRQSVERADMERQWIERRCNSWLLGNKNILFSKFIHNILIVKNNLTSKIR